jgi:hypothetical protein
MVRKIKSDLQPYPRRTGEYLADDSLFPKSDPLEETKFRLAIEAAFKRTLTKKKGEKTSLELSPAELVNMCLKHLKERSDPILSPSFLGLLKPSEVFIMDAVSHEMQRYRMKIGEFYQFLVIELMRTNFSNVYDGKREGDVEAEIDITSFPSGLRLYISVKKSKDTVGGQDIGGVFRRLESLGKEDKNLSKPYMGVFAIATPPRGGIDSYENSRCIRYKQDGSPYSPNIEEWLPGFIFPYICGKTPKEVYTSALDYIEQYLPFNTLKYRDECSSLLESKLVDLNLVDNDTGRIDAIKLVLNMKDKVVGGVRHRYVWHTIEALSKDGWYCVDEDIFQLRLFQESENYD